MNMTAWSESIIASDRKKPFPVLSFPGIQLTGCSMKDLLESSDIQARVMEAVAKRVDALASVSFMDLSVEAEAFGCPISQSDDEVPTVVGSILDEDGDPEALAVPQVGDGRTGLYVEAIKAIASTITDKPVFAGTIGPFSLAGRLMNINDIMLSCYDEPEFVHALLDKTTSFLVSYALAMKGAGANGVIMAEPMAGLLEADLAEEFSAPYVARIVKAVQDEDFIVIYHNCGNGVPQQIGPIVATGAKGFHFGNAIDMADIMAHIPADRFAAGNIDPAGCLRNGTPESVRTATLKLMEECSAYKNFIPSTGCDIPPMTPWENIDAFFDAIAEYYETREKVEACHA